jgi:hypothetical protein
VTRRRGRVLDFERPRGTALLAKVLFERRPVSGAVAVHHLVHDAQAVLSVHNDAAVAAVVVAVIYNSSSPTLVTFGVVYTCVERARFYSLSECISPTDGRTVNSSSSLSVTHASQTRKTDLN